VLHKALDRRRKKVAWLAVEVEAVQMVLKSVECLKISHNAMAEIAHIVVDGFPDVSPACFPGWKHQVAAAARELILLRLLRTLSHCDYM